MFVGLFWGGRSGPRVPVAPTLAKIILLKSVTHKTVNSGRKKDCNINRRIYAACMTLCTCNKMSFLVRHNIDVVITVMVAKVPWTVLGIIPLLTTQAVPLYIVNPSY